MKQFLILVINVIILSFVAFSSSACSLLSGLSGRDKESNIILVYSEQKIPKDVIFLEAVKFSGLGYPELISLSRKEMIAIIMREARSIGGNYVLILPDSPKPYNYLTAYIYKDKS